MNEAETRGDLGQDEKKCRRVYGDYLALTQLPQLPHSEKYF